MLDHLTGAVIAWKKRRRAQKHQELVYRVIREIHDLTVTFHGRLLLKNLYSDPDNGVEPELKRMFYVLSVNAPLEEWSQWN